AGRAPGEAAAATEDVDGDGASTETSDVATTKEPGTGADEEPAAAQGDASGEQPATGEAAEGEPTAGDRTATTGATGAEDHPEEAEVGAEQATTPGESADTAAQPDVAESAAGGETADIAESADAAEQPDLAASADAAEQPDAAEPAAAAEQPDGTAHRPGRHA